MKINKKIIIISAVSIVLLAAIIAALYYFVIQPRIETQKNKTAQIQTETERAAATKYHEDWLNADLFPCSSISILNPMTEASTKAECESLAQLQPGMEVSDMTISAVKATRRLTKISFSGQARILADYYLNNGSVCFDNLDSISALKIPYYDNKTSFCIASSSVLQNKFSSGTASTSVLVDIKNYIYESCGLLADDCSNIISTADLVGLVTSTADIAAEKAANDQKNAENAKNQQWQNMASLLPDNGAGVDRASFQHVGNCYAKDKGQVFFNIYCGQDNKYELMKADPASFVEIYYNFSKDKNNVYFSGKPIVGADVKTFKLTYQSHNMSTSSYYSIDYKSAYYQNEPLIESDPNTFTVIGEDSLGNYAKDKNHVYLGGSIIKDADPATYGGDWDFSPDYTYDKNHVFYREVAMPGADPKTFQDLGNGYAKDAEQVYYATSTVIGADSKTFAIITPTDGVSGNFAKDNKQVYLNGKAISGSNPASYQLLTCGYAKDDKHVYYMSVMIKQAVAASFSVNNSTYCDCFYSFGQDGQHVFLNGKVVVGAEPTSFKILKPFYSFDCSMADNTNYPYAYPYATDKNNVYFGGKIISGADPASFIFFGKTASFGGLSGIGCAYDKNGFYLGGKLTVSGNGAGRTLGIQSANLLILPDYVWTNGQDYYGRDCQPYNLNCKNGSESGGILYCD
jgi:hypothetical protein